MKNRREWKNVTVLTAIMVIILAAYIIIFQNEYSFKPIQDEKALGDLILASNSILSENGKIIILFIGAKAYPF